jgi:hypothetical protein
LPGPPAATAGDPGERDPAGAATADDPEPALAGADRRRRGGARDRGPREELEEALTPFHEERTERVLDRVKRIYQEDADLETLATAAYEGLADVANEELRQIVTRLTHAIQLGLMETDPGERPISREKALDLLDALHHAGDLLDAHLSREGIAKLFLNLSGEPFHISEAVRRRLRKRGLEACVAADLEPVPRKGDEERLAGAITEFVDHLIQRAVADPTVLLRLRWQADRVIGFIGLRPADLSLETLIDELGTPPILQEGNLRPPARVVDLGVPRRNRGRGPTRTRWGSGSSCQPSRRTASPAPDRRGRRRGRLPLVRPARNRDRVPGDPRGLRPVARDQGDGCPGTWVAIVDDEAGVRRYLVAGGLGDAPVVAVATRGGAGLDCRTECAYHLAPA